MITFQQFLEEPPSVPALTVWYIVDVAEALGKQELYTKQALQKLKALREHALVESAISSNRIEGVEVEHKRIATIVRQCGYDPARVKAITGPRERQMHRTWSKCQLAKDFRRI